MIDLNDAEFLSGDRRSVYANLRATAPVFAVPAIEGVPTWIVSRFRDVQKLLQMPGGRVQPAGQDAPRWMPEGPARQRLHANLAQVDAPLHTRLRGVLRTQFMPGKMEALRAISADSVARSLRAVANRTDGFDVVQEFAAQVPKGVICHLLGIPEADWEPLIEMQHDFLQIFSVAPLSAEQQQRLDDVTAFYLDYFEGLLQKGNAAERPPLIELLLAAQSRGELSRLEVLSIMHTVLDAGYETTRTSISNAVELLANVPGLFEQIRAAPEKNSNAVEELLRYQSPIHVRARFLIERYTASDGTLVPAGAQVLLLLASANQDDEVFSDPQQIDILRSNASQHQAFGGGMHHCLGAPIARIQLQETLRALSATYTGFELPDGSGPRFPSLVFPALSSLRVVPTHAELQ